MESVPNRIEFHRIRYSEMDIPQSSPNHDANTHSYWSTFKNTGRSITDNRRSQSVVGIPLVAQESPPGVTWVTSFFFSKSMISQLSSFKIWFCVLYKLILLKIERVIVWMFEFTTQPNKLTNIMIPMFPLRFWWVGMCPKNQQFFCSKQWKIQ